MWELQGKTIIKGDSSGKYLLQLAVPHSRRALFNFDLNKGASGLYLKVSNEQCDQDWRDPASCEKCSIGNL